VHLYYFLEKRRNSLIGTLFLDLIVPSHHCISLENPIKLLSILQLLQRVEATFMKSSKLLVMLMVIILLAVPLFTSCSTQSAPIQDPGGEEDAADPIGDEEDQGNGEESGEPGLAYLTCPEEPVTFKLEFNHTFEFSPEERMHVTGNTSAGAWCLVVLNGNVIEADDCIIDYEFSGFIQGSDAKCDIQGASTALISIEGECLDRKSTGDENDPVAEIYLTITEGQDPDADLGGVINCPGYSNSFLSFYPATFSLMTFGIVENGASDNDSGLDFSGLYDYDKTWSLIPVGYPFGL